MLTKLKRLDDALPQFNSALEIRARLVEIDKTEFTYADYLASSHGDVGNVFKAQGKLGDAIEQYEKALIIREPSSRRTRPIASGNRACAACRRGSTMRWPTIMSNAPMP